MRLGNEAAPASPFLVPYLDSPNICVRTQAAHGLWKITGNSEWLRHLVRDATSPLALERRALAQALGDLPVALTEVLGRLFLRDSAWQVRVAAAEALGRAGPRASGLVQELRRLAQSGGEDERVRDAARASLRAVTK